MLQQDGLSSTALGKAGQQKVARRELSEMKKMSVIIASLVLWALLATTT